MAASAKNTLFYNIKITPAIVLLKNKQTNSKQKQTNKQKTFLCLLVGHPVLHILKIIKVNKKKVQTNYKE